MNYNNNNNNNNYDEYDQLFVKYEEEYNKFKNLIKREISDYNEMLVRERNQANLYRNKIQLRDVLVNILPILTEIKNEVLESNDLDELKLMINYKYKQLISSFKRSGVEIISFENEQLIDPTQIMNLKPKPTGEKELDMKVANLESFGCIIRGEENLPILPSVEIYIYDETIPSTKNTDENNLNYNEPNIDQNSQINNSINHELKNNEVYNESSSSESKNLDKNITDNGQLYNSNNILDSCSYDIEIASQNSIKFIKPIVFIHKNNENKVVTSISNNNTPHFINSANVALIKTDQTILEGFYDMYFGNKLLYTNVDLKSSDLRYKIIFNDEDNSIILKIIDKNSNNIIIEKNLIYKE